MNLCASPMKPSWSEGKQTGSLWTRKPASLLLSPGRSQPYFLSIHKVYPCPNLPQAKQFIALAQLIDKHFALKSAYSCMIVPSVDAAKAHIGYHTSGQQAIIDFDQFFLSIVPGEFC